MLTPQQNGDRQGENRLEVEQQRAGGGRQAGQPQHQRNWSHHPAEQGEHGKGRPVFTADRGFCPGPANQPHRQKGQGGAGVEQARDAQG